MFKVNLPIGLEKTFRNCRLLLQVILERMPELWRQMDWDPVSIEGAAKYWREDILVQRRISPEITTSTVIAWRRNIPYSLAVSKMIEEINAFQA